MKPVDFDYAAPCSVDETLALLAAWRREATILAGGQSLIPLLVARTVRPKVVIDINRITGLDFITEADGAIRVGATVRQADCEGSPVVQDACPLLAEAIGWVATPQVRNLGTVVGSLAQRNAISQIPTVAVTLGARLVVVDTGHSERIVDAEDFLDARSPATLQPNEVVLECSFPAQRSGSAWGFYEVQRRAAHYALVGAAVTYATDAAGTMLAVRVAASGLARRPIRLRGVEAALTGRVPTGDVFAAAARRALDDPELEPVADIHATAAYRRTVAPTVVERALLAALARR